MTAAIAAQLADLGTFLVMIAAVGPAAEANPLVAAALVAGGVGLAIALKVALLVVLATWRRAVRRYAGAVSLAGLLAGLVGAVSNARAVWG